MNVLIAGSAGQIGTALMRAAPAKNQVTGLTHKQLDITDEQAVLTYVCRLRPQLIINAAAYTSVENAEVEQPAARRVNEDGPRNLALAARETGARLLHISTDFVFDGTASSPYAPDAKTNPLNIYGRTKLAGEEQVLGILAGRCVVLRTAWVYSALGNNFLRSMLRLMANGGPVRVVADQTGTPTAAHSVADVLWRLAERPEVAGLHHWSDTGIATWYEFAVAIAEDAAQIDLLPAVVTVHPIRTSEYPTRARRPAYSVLDKSSLINSLGVTPPHWRENLRTVLRELADA